MSEFTHLISSTALTETPEAAVQSGCPRELIGLSCIVSEYDCMCELVDSSTIETVPDGNGGTALVRLSMTLAPGKGDPRAVMARIDLTGYKADYEASKQAVTASFNLRRPQNTGLRSFVREAGI